MVVSPDEAALVSLAQEFMQEIKDFTPGKKLEAKLNKDYGPHNKYYQGVGCPQLRRLDFLTVKIRGTCSLRSWHYKGSRMYAAQQPELVSTLSNSPSSTGLASECRSRRIEISTFSSPTAMYADVTQYRLKSDCFRHTAEELNWFSITAVYMDSLEESMFQGQYHAHPYGGQFAYYRTYFPALTPSTEINCSIQVPNTGPNPQLEGLEEFWVGVSCAIYHNAAEAYPAH